MRHGSLFSGIGGFDLAAQWMGWENVFQVEIDPFCQKVLEKNFPNTKRYGDIKEFDGSRYRGTIDVLSGGFPCQPTSVAGRRRGKDDDRWLWPEMLRVVDEIGPSFLVPENVNGIHTHLDEIISDLERIGYTTEPISIAASSIGANHIRERYWIVAYPHSVGLQRSQLRMSKNKGEGAEYAPVLPSLPFQLPQSENDLPKPYTIGGNDGVPNRVDRIKGLGNAIVPQVAYEIFKAIEAVR